MRRQEVILMSAVTGLVFGVIVSVAIDAVSMMERGQATFGARVFVMLPVYFVMGGFGGWMATRDLS